ncbi:ADQ_G0038590.mRNA.1.CDS.1 [Saccharomyces cerevisiae]|nr:ADQ_G0038590.mRNA.1.CDS.1 [Saccharomyces cerevisiae]CAI6819701.1 ADQ_G0038590.mRNA.1.CDS.1 [Saccharomyces cerevisiae]
MHLCQNGHYYKPHRASAEKDPLPKKRKEFAEHEGKAKRMKENRELLNFSTKEKRVGKCGVGYKIPQMKECYLE